MECKYVDLRAGTYGRLILSSVSAVIRWWDAFLCPGKLYTVALLLNSQERDGELEVDSVQELWTRQTLMHVSCTALLVELSC